MARRCSFTLSPMWPYGEPSRAKLLVLNELSLRTVLEYSLIFWWKREKKTQQHLSARAASAISNQLVFIFVLFFPPNGQSHYVFHYDSLTQDCFLFVCSLALKEQNTFLSHSSSLFWEQFFHGNLSRSFFFFRSRLLHSGSSNVCIDGVIYFVRLTINSTWPLHNPFTLLTFLHTVVSLLSKDLVELWWFANIGDIFFCRWQFHFLELMNSS